MRTDTPDCHQKKQRFRRQRANLFPLPPDTGVSGGGFGRLYFGYGKIRVITEPAAVEAAPGFMQGIILVDDQVDLIKTGYPFLDR